MKKKSAIILVIVLVVLIAAALIAWKTLSPEASEGAKTITVNVHHLDGSEKTYTVHTDAEFVRGALEPDIISGEEGPYGLTIYTVDGETADESLQQWWGYDVNGEMAMYGAESQVINDGDVLDFTLNEGW